MVLKLFHVEDPQIDTYELTDPHLKGYARQSHIREIFTALAEIFNHFHVGDTQFDMYYRVQTPFTGISVSGTSIYI